MVALDTGTHFPAVSTNSLFAILMTKLRQRMNGSGVPTQSQPQAASLTLSACNVAIRVQQRFKKLVFRIFQHVNVHVLLHHFNALIELVWLH
jgi:hypothetical protein